MSHSRQDIEDYHEGDALLIPLIVRDSKDERVDLGEAEVEYLIKEDRLDADEDAELEKTTDGGGIEIVDEEIGEAEILIETGDTEGWIPEDQEDITLHHVCRVTIDDKRATVFTGSFTIVI
ncbi:hypothetical protein [Natrononativus amylolyticus]|uniref:hypothetical protein n=1 Tax=Natrononativus amylolyticus TaxID=2963434 RepID=UPI0020CF81B8|nr:hypothetical protein [Natrononativus amylolyticus]